MVKQLSADFLGTFWLVLGGCGSAVLAAAFPEVGIGLVGVSLAFGLTVLTMAYTIGPISGCHLNPAVTAGLVAAGRFPAKEMVSYWAAQTLGAIAAIAVLMLIVSGKAGFDPATANYAANGFGSASPGGYSLVAGATTEIVMTLFFLLVILGATHSRAPAGFAPIAIGLALTLIHLISIPVRGRCGLPRAALVLLGDALGRRGRGRPALALAVRVEGLSSSVARRRVGGAGPVTVPPSLGLRAIRHRRWLLRKIVSAAGASAAGGWCAR
jgi:aquaporin Z